MLASTRNKMDNYGKVHQAQQKPFVVPVPKLATPDVELDGLGVGQLGILEIDESGLIPKYRFVNAPVDKKGVQFQIMQGTYANETAYMLHSNTNDYSKRGTTFKASDIVRWVGKKARKAAGTQKVAIGWDGINNEKNLDVDKFTDTHIHFRLRGGPVNKTMGHNMGFKDSVVISHECYDPCDAPEGNPMCSPGSRLRAAKQFVEEINRRQIGMQGTRPLTQLIRATIITSDEITGLVNLDSFEVSLPDNGDHQSLGSVQAQYPGIRVERKSYVDGFSTYRVVVPDGTAAPAAVTNAGITTLANCDVCPTGYTRSTPRKKFLVTLAAGAATTQFSNVAGYVSNTPVNKQLGGVDTYFVLSNISTNETTFANAINTAGGNAVFIGEDSAVCTLTTPTTYAWAATESLTLASKAYKITLADDECGNSRLAELEAAYPELTITGDAQPTGPASGTGECLRNYTTTVFSDPVDSNGCFPDIHTFSNAPAPFYRIPWVEVVDPQGEPANVGIILEGNVFRRNVPDELYDYWAFDQDDVDGVHIEVSTHNNNYMLSACKKDIPVTTLSYFTYPSGEGWFVRRQEEKAKGYEMDMYRRNPALRAVYGQQYFSKIEKFYDSYSLEVIGSGPKNGAFDRIADHKYIYTFYFEVGRGKEFENAINGLVASARNIDVLPVSL